METPAFARIQVVASSQVPAETGPTPTRRSPGRMSAATAGLGDDPVGQLPEGSGSTLAVSAVGVQATMPATWAVGCGNPIPTRRIPNRMNANTRFMNGPPSMMMRRFHTGSL